MTEKMTNFAKVWQQLCLSDCQLEDTPAYPLARTVKMPPNHGYETGAIAFRMRDLMLKGVENLEIENCSPESVAGNRLRLKITLKNLELQGNYALEVKPDPVVDLDTAGNLRELPPEVCQPGAAGADAQPGTLDPQKEEWLNQAREQRTELNKSSNGQNLMSVYNEHNETYDHVFRNYQALAAAWKANGATREMAGDTSESIKNDTTINNSQKQYTGNVTYNGNAFRQQLNVAVSCLYSDPDFDPRTGPPANSKFWSAAKAALSFGKGIHGSTGNTKDQVNELTKSQVYATVDQQQGGLPEVSDTEALQVLMTTEVGPGGAEVANTLDWIDLDESDRHQLAALANAIMKQKAQDAAMVGEPLFEGSCTALLERVEAMVEIAPESDSQPIKALVELPAFDLEIDDATWTGEVGLIARQRLEQTYFIRSLLCEEITDRLQQAMLQATETCLEAQLISCTFAKTS